MADGVENTRLANATVKNFIMTIISTASIVSSVLFTYFDLKSSMQRNEQQQETERRVNEIRLKVLEGRVEVLEQQFSKISDR